MQVAVAGMKHVRHGQPELLRQFFYGAQYFAEARARNRAVHAVVVRCEPTHRRERGLAPEPHPLAVRVVARRAYFGGLLRVHQSQHLRALFLDLVVSAVEFAQQDRRSVGRIARTDECFRRQRPPARPSFRVRPE